MSGDDGYGAGGGAGEVVSKILYLTEEDIIRCHVGDSFFNTKIIFNDSEFIARNGDSANGENPGLNYSPGSKSISGNPGLGGLGYKPPVCFNSNKIYGGGGIGISAESSMYNNGIRGAVLIRKVVEGVSTIDDSENNLASISVKATKELISKSKEAKIISSLKAIPTIVNGHHWVLENLKPNVPLYIYFNYDIDVFDALFTIRTIGLDSGSNTTLTFGSAAPTLVLFPTGTTATIIFLEDTFDETLTFYARQ